MWRKPENVSFLDALRILPVILLDEMVWTVIGVYIVSKFSAELLPLSLLKIQKLNPALSTQIQSSHTKTKTVIAVMSIAAITTTATVIIVAVIATNYRISIKI
jgi:hypothetical protein